MDIREVKVTFGKRRSERPGRYDLKKSKSLHRVRSPRNVDDKGDGPYEKDLKITE